MRWPFAPSFFKLPVAHEMIFSPGRDEVGLQPAVAGRALGGEIRDAINVRHVAMRRADGDGEVGVARVIDRQSHSRAGRADRGLERAVAGIAGGDHDDDAGFHQAIDLDAERALAAGEPLRLEVVAEAHVHAVDEQAAGRSH